VIRLQGLALAPPELPRRGWSAASWQAIASVALHVVAIAGLVTLVGHSGARGVEETVAARATLPDQTTHMIFIARPAQVPGGGGGGGGNRQPGPIRQAEGIGHDRMTVPVRKTAPPSPLVESPTAIVLDSPAPVGLLLDAKPLASGTREQIGLLEGGVAGATSQGPGSGGGVGEGTGTGIGPGQGPGIGPGSGGGIGGGLYRPGGSVTTPRLLVQVPPKYTDDALLRKVQGTVELELVVTKEGRPAEVRVRRSLDPGGLDERAIAAVNEWRFEPGRLAGRPVDVLVTVYLDFTIR
jgi:periplasmic protein TonB